MKPVAVAALLVAALLLHGGRARSAPPVTVAVAAAAATPLDPDALAARGHHHKVLGLALLLAGTGFSLAAFAVTLEGFVRYGSIYGEPRAQGESIAVAALSTVGQSLCIVGVPFYMVGATEEDLAARLRLRAALAPSLAGHALAGATIALSGSF